ncbi:hypothetical protein A2685_02490 [Candidatus Woesebacteria bacterium RIFCSPHIGHO2_01_FULL_37_10]|uniref:Helix-turn-helix domain-containing protein n=1 Tax=Candidatus Woesebacteria bacterium RIFCSPHIGHO2_01_FULL_37_10 TaxID=1802489 RepID=A0A1F7XUJ0_9BACT|nr:MAG: hypothetical protein A2685_02490 [Candidatus Woesebacteria bacterium RIFCSPHIGHO2_01_FULL_37_10]
MVDNLGEKLPELLKLKQACEVLKVHPNTLRAWDKKGILVAVRIGEKKIRRYRKEDLLAFINKKNIK